MRGEDSVAIRIPGAAEEFARIAGAVSVSGGGLEHHPGSALRALWIFRFRCAHFFD